VGGAFLLFRTHNCSCNTQGYLSCCSKEAMKLIFWGEAGAGFGKHMHKGFEADGGIV
jgi:hypothetical protein